MVSDDVMYGVVAVLSVAAGCIFKDVLKDSSSKRWLSTVLGFAGVWLVCGSHIVHLMITVVGNCVLLASVPPSHHERDLPGKSFLWNFGYLTMFRMVHWMGIPAPSPVTNAAQLFLTLRMVGLAFEIQDSYSRIASLKEKTGSDNTDVELKIKYCNIHVTSLGVITYAFCYIGLLTGPYFKYRTYQDWLNLPATTDLNRWTPFCARAKQLPVIAACFLFFSYFFNIMEVETEEFLERPFLYRLLYMVPMFIIFRTRLYLAWIMSELMCVTAGLGAYPDKSSPKCGEGPTNLKQLDIVREEEKKNMVSEYSFETVHNIDIYGCELAPMTKQGLRSWNMTVQYWLANYVHRRVPPSLRAHRVAVTMTVSAFWHGIHPGYYLSFLTVPPILMAEDVMIKAFRNEATPSMQQAFDWACWFFKMRGFDYMCMGFLLLRLGSTLRYWYSIYFLGHVVILIFVLVGKLALALRPRTQVKNKE